MAVRSIVRLIMIDCEEFLAGKRDIGLKLRRHPSMIR